MIVKNSARVMKRGRFRIEIVKLENKLWADAQKIEWDIYHVFGMWSFIG